MEKEIWKDILGYEGLYQVSNSGKVKSLSFNRTNKSRILKNAITRGYVHITLFFKNKRKVTRIHRLVGTHFVPNPENKPEINHKDGDKTNNNDWNLEWVTSYENSIHAIHTGLSSTFGENVHTSKLKSTDIPIIFMRYNQGHRVVDIAKDYNISDTSIRDIIKRRKWKHIEF